MSSSLQIKNLELYREDTRLLSIDEQIFGGDILTVMGPSGSGKSSFLKLAHRHFAQWLSLHR